MLTFKLESFKIRVAARLPERLLLWSEHADVKRISCPIFEST